MVGWLFSDFSVGVGYFEVPIHVCMYSTEAWDGEDSPLGVKSQLDPDHPATKPDINRIQQYTFVCMYSKTANPCRGWQHTAWFCYQHCTIFAPGLWDVQEV